MPFTDTERRQLLRLASQAVTHGLLGHGEPLPPLVLTDYPPVLQALGASFVTLHHRQQLRGCMGSLLAVRPLAEDVVIHAYAAAFKDPRFNPLRQEEWPELAIHLSVLDAPEILSCQDEADLLRQLRPGVDGLILSAGQQRATFLPAVWETLPDPQAFVRQLKRKAGLPVDYWSAELRLARYTVEAFGQEVR